MSTPDRTRKTVFISHSSADHDAAQRICDLLEERGVPCWIAPRDIRPGQDYGEEIINALEETGALLLVLTDHANASRHVATEVSRAFSKGKTILPVRMANVMPSKGLELFVSSAHWVEAWQGGLEEKMSHVAGVLLGTPAQAPTPAKLTAAPAKRSKLIPTLAAAAAVMVVAAAAFVMHSRSGQTSQGAAKPPEIGSTTRGTTPPVTPPVQTVAGLPRYQAIVIGINDYKDQGGAGWNKLVNARPDAEAVANMLETKYGFSVTRLFDDNATHGAIMTSLDGLASLTDNDACLIYFAGHGSYDKALDEGYWIPSDARRTVGARQANEDWIWNTTLTKILGASQARHILVVADSCYGGSLFRGEEIAPATADMTWYRSALAKPSRFLIASGDLEPVLDSGGQHSAFAQQVLNYLEHGDKSVFSASDLGLYLREKAGVVSGQMVRMGPLPVSRHAGGEFVFVKAGSPAAQQVAGGEAAPAAGSPAATPANKQQALQDAIALTRGGATNAASRLMTNLSAGDSSDKLVQMVAAYLSQDRQSKAQSQLRDLIATLEKRKAAGNAGTAGATAARPRIVACIGPSVAAGLGDESLGSLYRICLSAQIQQRSKVIVVEREAIEQIMQELNLGSSDLSDARAKVEIGKLLPAGMLLIGDVLPSKKGEKLFLRLVDTETTKILGTISGDRTAEQDVADVCDKCADQLVALAVKSKPLTAKVTRVADKTLQAEIGQFHGAGEGMQFTLCVRDASGAEKPVGKAKLTRIGEASSDFAAEWSGEPMPADSLWLKEAAEEKPQA
jgi:hypothetical protein